jgi:exosome complex component RRP42
METSKNTRKRIIEYLEEEKRFDERKPFEFRDLKIETHISKNSEGSARVKLGKTEVVVGVKMDVSVPYSNEPDKGTMVTTTELLPLSSERFDYGPPNFEAISIARIVDRTLRECDFIDFGKLCIKSGEKVWSIFIDIYPINDAGNIIDAACIAAVAALLTATFPEYDEKTEKVRFGEYTTKKLPLSELVPLLLTFHKIGKKIVVDPITEEEDVSEARISFGLTKDKEVKINACQKENETAFSTQELSDILDKSEEIFEKLHPEIMEKIKKSAKTR